MSELPTPSRLPSPPAAPALRPGLQTLAGEVVGRDPRRMTSADLADLGHAGTTPLKAIRAHCLECGGGQAGEVRRCTVVQCPLWSLRMGSNPFARRTLSEAQREAQRGRAAAARARRLTEPA